MAEKFPDFESFWPYYLGEHGKPLTRRLHTIGTVAAIGLFGAYALTRKRSLLLGAFVSSYGPAWASHFLIEKNRPATFTYPLWSLRGDLRMFRLTVLGQIDDEIARLAADKAAREAAAPPAPANGASTNGASAHDVTTNGASPSMAS
jgi:hypothetical protein